MIINRHNYEEYFILYMDNELSSDDRRQVEEFVEKNPDLKEELELLLQYKLEPDTSIVFENKSQLIREPGNSPVNLANYTEWLLLYVDDEITPVQRMAVEQFIEQHPVAQKELFLLLQTRLHPEPVAFGDKSILYRREKRAAVLFTGWRRIAAAAVLLIAAGTTAVMILNQKPSADNNMANGPSQVQKTNTDNKSSNIAIANTNNNQPATPVSKEVIKPVDVKSIPGIAAKKDHVIPKNAVIPNEEKQQPVIANNNLPDPSSNSSRPTGTDLAGNNSGKKINQEIVNPYKAVTSATTQPSDMMYASNTSGKTDAVDLNETGGKKNKLRGLFRKVTRTFEKTTNIDATDDDDRVLIGGLAIRLK